MNAITEKDFDAMAQAAIDMCQMDELTGGVLPMEGGDKAAWMKRISVVNRVISTCAQISAWGIGATNNKSIIGGVEYHGNFTGPAQRVAVTEFVESRLPEGENVTVTHVERDKSRQLLAPIMAEAKALLIEFRKQFSEATS